MADQLAVVAAAAGGGVAVAAGGGVAAAAGGGAAVAAGQGVAVAPGDVVAGAARGRRVREGPRLYPLVRNDNRSRPLTVRSKKKVEEDIEIKLTQDQRVDNEDVNAENEKLIQIYNDIMGVGKQYKDALTSAVVKKNVPTQELQRLMGNFHELIKKIKPQEAAVRGIGGHPAPFPVASIRKLPGAFQHIMKSLKG